MPWSSHNPEAAGSSPAPAIKRKLPENSGSFFILTSATETPSSVPTFITGNLSKNTHESLLCVFLLKSNLIRIQYIGLEQIL